jgi:histidinol-phosphate aminotransferase
MALEFSEKIRRIPVYPTAGGYALGDEYAMLASNEAPFGLLPGVQEATLRALQQVNRYPDPSNMRLRRALAARYDFPPDRIAIGAGSCDILLSAGEALLEPGAELIYAWPSFSVYPQMAAATGARAIAVPLDTEDRHDLDAMRAEITVATRLVLICNPNNPTSTALPLDRIAAFVADVPRNVCVLVDEAYCEFSTLDDPDASLELVRRHPNVVLLRTFSKVYGLAGLRCGYALCGEESFRVALAQAAAEEARRHEDEITRRVEQTVAERIGLEEELRALGLTVADSQANFVWHSLGNGEVDAERERAIMDGLAERKVLIRAGSALGREGWARTTIGTAAENRRFLDALRDLL